MMGVSAQGQLGEGHVGVVGKGGVVWRGRRVNLGRRLGMVLGRQWGFRGASR